MFYVTCDFCGKKLQNVPKSEMNKFVGEAFCPQCSAFRNDVATCGQQVLGAAKDVAGALRLKGVDLKAQVSEFESKMVEDFLSTSRKLVEDHWRSLEELPGKEVEDGNS